MPAFKAKADYDYDDSAFVVTIFSNFQWVWEVLEVYTCQV